MRVESESGEDLLAEAIILLLQLLHAGCQAGGVLGEQLHLQQKQRNSVSRPSVACGRWAEEMVHAKVSSECLGHEEKFVKLKRGHVAIKFQGDRKTGT
jgi:hypothetical protein